MDKLMKHLRVVPEHIDLKRSLSLHLLKDSSSNDARPTDSFPIYSARPNSFVASTPVSTILATLSDEDRDDTIELLRSSLNFAAGKTPALRPFQSFRRQPPLATSATAGLSDRSPLFLWWIKAMKVKDSGPPLILTVAVFSTRHSQD